MTDPNATGNIAVAAAGGTYGSAIGKSDYSSQLQRHSIRNSPPSDDGGSNVAIPREAGATLLFERSLESASSEMFVGSLEHEVHIGGDGIVLSPGGISFDDNMGMNIEEVVKPSSRRTSFPGSEDGRG